MFHNSTGKLLPNAKFLILSHLNPRLNVKTEPDATITSHHVAGAF